MSDATGSHAADDPFGDKAAFHNSIGGRVGRIVKDATADRMAQSQAQDSLREQIIRVLTLATLHGEYDAADWISRAFFGENTDA